MKPPTIAPTKPRAMSIMQPLPRALTILPARKPVSSPKKIQPRTLIAASILAGGLSHYNTFDFQQVDRRLHAVADEGCGFLMHGGGLVGRERRAVLRPHRGVHWRRGE